MLLEPLQGRGKPGNVPFLGGYFRALFDSDPQRWEKELETLARDGLLNAWVPELTWRSGMSNQAALRVLRLVKQGIVGIEQLSPLGFAMRGVSEESFKQWIDFFMASSDSRAASIALDWCDSYYIRDETKYPLPQELTLKVLINPALLRKPDAGRRYQMDDYYWTEIGKAFINAYPEKSLELADKMLEHFNEEGTIFENYHSRTNQVLKEIIRRYPEEIWRRVTKYLGPPIDSRAFHLKEWLRGGDLFETEALGALSFIPPEEIWAWVNGNIEKRAWYLASFVPKDLFLAREKTSLAREVLVRYGKREDVRRSLMANFSTEGWSGPASVHLQNKKQQLVDYRKGEDNENVKRWIDEYVRSLDHQIERERVSEEREE